MRDLIGRTLGHYRIVEKIGEGGMGEVYRANDERLDRDVAIKILPVEVADDPDRLGRFEREAKALAQLTHPNILQIFEFGEDQGVTFAATELLEGETLRERIEQGPLPWRKAVEITASAADGLSAAHAEGIIHRDLKPENVFLTTDGRVKVLDFGLAKVAEGPVEHLETVTSPSPGTVAGTVLGTVGYMAPEQVRGEPADARSDIFALGCVFYEMLTGSSPFRRQTAAETTAAILRDEAPEVSLSKGELTPELNRVVTHCLEKKPRERFQSAADLAFDLRSLGTSASQRAHITAAARRGWLRAGLGALALLAVGTAVVVWSPWWGRSPGVVLETNRVLVLPFENRTGDAAMEPLARMTSDWITQGLSRLEGIEVVPSWSVLIAERTDASVDAESADLARSLVASTGVGLVVSGAYYLQGPSLQFQAAITDVADNRIVAALEPVRGDVSSPMEVVDTLRQRVLGAVASNVDSRHAPGTMQRAPLSSTMQRAPMYEAYREFILGIELFLSDDEAALRHFERAAEIDPKYPLPLAYATYLLHHAGEYDRAEKTLRTALGQREAFTPFGRHFLDGFAAYTSHRYAQARRHMVEAEKLAPRDPMAALWVGLLSHFVNEPRRTLEAYAKFPVQPWGSHLLGDSWVSHKCGALHRLGEHERELAVAREAIASQPGWPWVRSNEIAALAALGRVDEAVQAAEGCVVDPDMADRAGEVLLDGAAELRVHGHREASMRLANLAVSWYEARPDSTRPSVGQVGLHADALRYAERWKEAAQLLRPVVADGSDAPRVIGMLGGLEGRLGDREGALEASEKLRRLDEQHLFGGNTFRRACIAAVLGEREDATALLRQAIAEGLGYGWFLHTEIDLETLWGYPPFQELMEPKG
jgi:tetratricopeptide (TPR) repeat protein/TolB-like protein